MFRSGLWEIVVSSNPLLSKGLELRARSRGGALALWFAVYAQHQPSQLSQRRYE
jgi:hypothetical protein